MFSIDEMTLFAGRPIDFYGICYIYPLTLNEIIGLGNKFEMYLSLLTINMNMRLAKRRTDTAVL